MPLELPLILGLLLGFGLGLLLMGLVRRREELNLLIVEIGF